MAAIQHGAEAGRKRLAAGSVGQRSLERVAGRCAADGEDDPLEPAAGVEMLAHLAHLNLRGLLVVARRMISADVGPPSSMVAAWMIHVQGI
jgi:hypothetical protein